MSDIIVYHENCFDGGAGAYLLKLAYPNAVTIPMNYGPLNQYTKISYLINMIKKEDDLYIVDFCFSKDIIESIANRCNKIVILDHHKTAIESMQNLSLINVELILDDKKSGAGLALNWVSKIVEVPKNTIEIIKYIEDADLYKWDLPESRKINCGISIFRNNPNYIGELFRNYTIKELSRLGLYIKIKEDKDIDLVLNTSVRKIKIGDTILDAANCSVHLISRVCYKLIENGNPYGVAYFDSSDGRHFSLRSDDNHTDVSEIAKIYCGGGHRNASGFIIPYNQLKYFEID